VKTLGRIVLILWFAFLAKPDFAFAQFVRQAGAEASIVRPLSFIYVKDLDFGTILRGSTGGTVTLSPFNVRTASAGITLVPSTTQAAEFAGWGSNNQNVDISLSANTITLTRIGGTQTMTMNTFIVGSTPTAQLTIVPRRFRIVSTTGVFQFPLGATLNIGANQMPGSYKGTFNITLNYQ
jgi:hypothetical protein